MQINNLITRYNKGSNKWQVITFDKKVLEEFVELGNAIVFMEETFDFCSRKTVITAIKRKIKELNGVSIFGIEDILPYDVEVSFFDKNNAIKFQDYCSKIFCIKVSDLKNLGKYAELCGYHKYFICYKVDK